MLSSGLSGTYNLARILAGECAEQGYAMKVFDSVSGALGQGMTVLLSLIHILPTTWTRR